MSRTTGPDRRGRVGARERVAADPLWQAVRLLDVRWSRVLRAVVLGTLALGSSVGLAAVAAWLIARASQMPPVLTLSVAVVGVRAFGISRGVFRYLERLASHDVALRGMASLRANLYEALATGSPAALVRLRRGDLLARVGSDVDDVGDVVVRALVPAGIALGVSAGSVLLVGAFLPAAGVALALCLVLTAVVAPWLSARAARGIEERGSVARAAMTATTLEILEDSGPLAVSGRLPARFDDLRTADRDLARSRDDGARTAGVSAGIGAGAVGLAVLASLLLGLPALASGALTPEELSVVVLTPLAVFEAANALPGAAVQLHRSRQAARRVMSLLEVSSTQHRGRSPRAGHVAGPTSGPAPPIDPGPSGADRSLVLDGVACAWPGTGRVVVAGVDLALRPGRAVALVGASGVGKTTLLATAAGLLHPAGGSATLDGTDVGSLPRETAARGVVLVAEDGHVFDTTLLENLRVARGDVTPAEAEAVLHEVGLQGWLDRLPDGVETLVGPDAADVSGGERRRLLVARALLAPAPLLLVDEPAEHLDALTADALVRHLVATTRTADGAERGLVVATHRLSALEDVDEVVLLGHAPGDPDGPACVVARGTHAELLDVPAYRWALAQEDAVPR
ncbi:thiol reductant ABC exporter subunit CydC [Cellulosimicrobium arenosum]|uniref:Thiol reductant ABC exporter subunit CydC n=1 Tax=Cellulosimicrobium arenosum TaxID=2708133 RepID=A0A927J2D3_9MICO|nr:thiol reductant ABC exporter subunit CydC [Cellulosimicrobium arenosum]MBD8080669.1 thiol reductant ABC exporter subunit CydC [Cellulosimicrobium arenosum]